MNKGLDILKFAVEVQEADSTERKLIEEIQTQYGSVGKMIALVNNNVAHLREYGGHEGRDGADTLRIAMCHIPNKFHKIYYKYAHSTHKP